MLADEKTRKLALEPEQSFIVQAPAGSGKTELLIQRYLKLLGLANSPEEILAMTFTRKAAAEMKERVFSALTEAKTQNPPEKAHAKFTWKLAKKVLDQDQSLHHPETPRRRNDAAQYLPYHQSKQHHQAYQEGCQDRFF